MPTVTYQLEDLSLSLEADSEDESVFLTLSDEHSESAFDLSAWAARILAQALNEAADAAEGKRK